jgi:hypothetical protein
MKKRRKGKGKREGERNGGIKTIYKKKSKLPSRLMVKTECFP